MNHGSYSEQPIAVANERKMDMSSKVPYSKHSRRLTPWRLLLIAAVTAYLGALLYIPGVFVMYAVGPALFGAAIVAVLIVIQYPFFMLSKRMGRGSHDRLDGEP
ncbi:MAG TPA: hypothetical protein VML55_26440 [Planctomycetaceae bacterium]|nr:hypothetical protein [Planctomycetaceae bacterium]